MYIGRGGEGVEAFKLPMEAQSGKFGTQYRIINKTVCLNKF